ncbi:hypothetical protein SANTM175S_00545 [Streptomyces antimycoticus]
MPSDCSTADGRTAMNTAPAPPGPPSTRLILLFAVACGSAVANVYFAQPLLVTLGERFALGPGLLGAIVAITQLGYAAGLFLLVPLGDLVDRRRLIPLQLGLLAAPRCCSRVWRPGPLRCSPPSRRSVRSPSSPRPWSPQRPI